MMRRRVAQARVARLATVGVDDRPHVVPVCFSLDDDTLTFVVDHKPKSTNVLRRVENIRANASVSLVIDQYDEDWDQLWWVRLDGRGHIVDADDPDFDTVIEPLREKYRGQYGIRPLPGPAVVVAIERWAGWSAT
jgi:PPOX class probable F420-dependent enzyme